MDIGELFLGIVLVAVSVGGLWFALPKEDGQVRPFLRTEQAQTYYTVAVISIFAIGMVNIVIGIVPGQSSSMFDNRPVKKSG